jgi:predicted CoA-binding protein
VTAAGRTARTLIEVPSNLSEAERMATIDPLVADFLAQRRIAVAGVSRKGRSAANAIYKKLKGAGYEVYAVNPNAESIDGDKCYPDLKSLPSPPEGVVIATNSSRAAGLVRQCIEAGTPRVWMHCSLGSTHKAAIKWAAKSSSVSEEAVSLCRSNDISVITGACPMMFCKPVDPAHTLMRGVLRLFGGLGRWD